MIVDCPDIDTIEGNSDGGAPNRESSQRFAIAVAQLRNAVAPEVGYPQISSIERDELWL